MTLSSRGGQSPRHVSTLAHWAEALLAGEGAPGPMFPLQPREDCRGLTETHSTDFPCPGQPGSDLGGGGSNSQLWLGCFRGGVGGAGGLVQATELLKSAGSLQT